MARSPNAKERVAKQSTGLRRPAIPSDAASSVKEIGRAAILFSLIALAFFASPLLREKVIAHGDGSIYYFPLRAFFGSPLNFFWNDWNSFNFLGYQISGTMQTASFYLPNLLFSVLPSVLAFNLFVVLHYALAALFTWLLAREIGCSGYASFLAALSFAFGGFLQAHRGHVSMASGAAWLPFLLYCSERFRKTKSWHWVFAQALVLAMQVFAGYAAVVLYSAIAMAVYLVVGEWKTHGSWRSIARAIPPITVAGCLSLLAAAPQLVAALKTLSASYRSGFDPAFAAAGSLPPWALPTAIFPFFLGGGFGLPLVAGYDVVEFGFYCGSLTIIGAALAISARGPQRSDRVIWVVLALLSLAIMLGRFTPLGELFIRLPGLSMFRYHARMSLVLDLAIAVLFAIGMDRFVFTRSGLSTIRPRFLWSFVLVVGLFAAALAAIPATLVHRHVFDIPGIARYLSQQGVDLVNRLWRPDSLAVTLPLCLAGINVIVLGVLRRFRLKARFTTAILGAILLGDLYLFSLRYDTSWPNVGDLSDGLATGTFVSRSPMVDKLPANEPWTRYLKIIDTPYSQAVAVPNGSLNLLDHRSNLGGTEPLIPNTMRTLFGMLQNGVPQNPQRLLRDNVLLSLAATRYLIVSEELANSLIPAIPVAVGAEVAALAVSAERLLLTPLQFAKSHEDWMWRHPVPLNPGERYFVEFRARVTGGKVGPPGAGHALVVDLYGGEQFDAPHSEIALFSTDLADSERTFASVLDAYSEPLPTAELRIYNAGGASIEVTGLRLMRLPRRELPVSVQARARSTLYAKVAHSGGEVLLENLNARNRLQCVSEISPVSGYHDALRRLLAWQVDFNRTALIEASEITKTTQQAAGHLGCGTVAIKHFESGDVRAEVTSDKPQFIVFSEQYDPGWRVYVDGQRVSPVRCDLFAQGVLVPAGKHSIRFVFRPGFIVWASVGPLLFAALWYGLSRAGRL